jgi:hypothetical protein
MDGWVGDHHKIGGMMMEFTVEPWRWKTTMISKVILFIIWCLLSCLIILFLLYMWWMFCHDRITFLRKDEILAPFTNSCNYRVLIVVGWAWQSKVPSSIITNSVSPTTIWWVSRLDFSDYPFKCGGGFGGHELGSGEKPFWACLVSSTAVLNCWIWLL